MHHHGVSRRIPRIVTGGLCVVSRSAGSIAVEASCAREPRNTHRFAPRDYPQLLSLGIGLTDLCKVHSGTDAQLPENAFDIDAFAQKMARYRPALIAFTSKNAAQTFLQHPVSYGLQGECIGSSRLFVLTSPSGLATRFFDIEIWRQLANELQHLRA